MVSCFLVGTRRRHSLATPPFPGLNRSMGSIRRILLLSLLAVPLVASAMSTTYTVGASDLSGGQAGEPVEGGTYGLQPAGNPLVATATQQSSSYAQRSGFVGLLSPVSPGTLTLPDFDDWLQTHGMPGAQPNDDPGNRGISLLLRYALGMDLQEPDRARLPQAVSHQTAGPQLDQPGLALRFERLKEAPGLTYIVETSSDLVNWTPLSTVHATVIADYGPRQLIEYADPTPLHNGPRFLRLKIEKSD